MSAPGDPIFMGTQTIDFEARTITHANADGEVTKVETFSNDIEFTLRLYGLGES